MRRTYTRDVASTPKDGSPGVVGASLLRVAGAVAGITFFFYLVGVAVEVRRLKTLDLPADAVVAALPHDLLLIIGARSLVVPIALGSGAVLLIELLHSAEGWGLRRALALLLGFVLAVAALGFIFIPSSRDLRIEHVILVAMVSGIASAGWLLEYRLRRISHSAWFAFATTALAGAVVAYVHALVPPVHLDHARVVKKDGTQSTGMYVGKNADDVFLTPSVARDRTCGVLTIIPTSDIATISLTKAKAVKVDKGNVGCQKRGR
jgi:hypothetical protein